MREQEVEPKKIREMKKPRRGWNGIPARVREELGIRGRAFYSDRVSSHGPIGLGGQVPWRISWLWQDGSSNDGLLPAVRGRSLIPVPVGPQIRIC